MSFFWSITLPANATLAAGSGVCAAVASPQSLSTAAQAHFRSIEGRRFIAVAPEKAEGWSGPYAPMRVNCERCPAEAEKRGTVTNRRNAFGNLKPVRVRP